MPISIRPVTIRRIVIVATSTLAIAIGGGCDVQFSLPTPNLGATGSVTPNTDSMTPGNNDTDVPDNAYCHDFVSWDADWTAFETAVLDLVNQQRAVGADCHSEGTFDPAGPLTMNAALRCAAREHSMDMAVRDYFDHNAPEGTNPRTRMEEAGYTGSSWAENIAWGYTTPADVVAGWMASDGHCANIMRSTLTETGIGYYEGNFWTETFGNP